MEEHQLEQGDAFASSSTPRSPQKKNKKIPKGIAEERSLTDLPLHIIHHIFSFLETIDVLRTSAVSRDWRYLWTSIPYFHFNLNTVWSDPSSKFESLFKTNEQFKDFVNWVLLYHDSSVYALKCTLHCLFFEGDKSVYRWMKWLVSRRVKEFELTLLDFGVLCLEGLTLELPDGFIKCESLEVLRLNLNGTALNFHRCVGFNGLKCLELKNVTLSNENITRNFVKACPLLEDFSMVQCFFQGFDISGRNMKRLTLQDCNYIVEDMGLLKVDCPSLTYFKYEGSLGYDFCLKDLLCLQEAFFYMDSEKVNRTVEECGYVLCEILKGLCNAKALKLSIWVIGYLSDAPISESSSLSFWSLKSLKLEMGMHECQLQSILILLKACPRLEALAIVFYEYEEDDWPKWQMPDEEMISQLKIIELANFSSNERELELIKFVLRKGHALEKVNIWWQLDVLDGSNTIQEQQKNNIVDEILSLPRSSSTVAFTFV